VVAAKRTISKMVRSKAGALLGMQGERIRAAVRNRYIRRFAPYIHRLTDEYTCTYICRLTDKCNGLCSSVEAICLSFGTEEYKITEECTPFFCSELRRIKIFECLVRRA
jgi:hypothetical protein